MKKLIIDVPDDMYDLIKNDPNAYYPCGEWVINGKILLEENGEPILRAMRESADTVKASPKYDFSCVTPLMEDSVPKKGKWSNKFKSDPSSIFGTTLISICSNCNKENSIGWTKYCPHCGAKMENGGEK